MTTPMKWRDAHAGLDVTESALETMAPFPSLSANDFINYLQGKGHGDEIVHFVRDLCREMVWTYDNWTKAQRDADPARLLVDLLNNAHGGAEYDFTQRFLRDYAKANNISLGAVTKEPPWHIIVQPGVVPIDDMGRDE